MTTATVNCKVCLHKIVGWFQMTIYRRSLTYMNFVSIALRISLNFHVKWTSNKNTSWIHFILICPQLIQSSFKVIPCKQNPLSRTYCIFLMHVSPQQKTILQFCFLVWDKKTHKKQLTSGPLLLWSWGQNRIEHYIDKVNIVFMSDKDDIHSRVYHRK